VSKMRSSHNEFEYVAEETDICASQVYHLVHTIPSKDWDQQKIAEYLDRLVDWTYKLEGLYHDIYGESADTTRYG